MDPDDQVNHMIINTRYTLVSNILYSNFPALAIIFIVTYMVQSTVIKLSSLLG